jgi:hypothetical protein
MEDIMKNLKLMLFFLFTLNGVVFAQNIDRSQYEETNSEDLAWWGDTTPRYTTKKFKMLIEFEEASGTSYTFRETHNKYGAYYQVSKRWNLTKGQKYMVYFTAKAPAPSGNGEFRVIDDIEINGVVFSKPWLPYVSNGKSSLHGWYLQDMGNGTYKEIFFE